MNDSRPPPPHRSAWSVVDRFLLAAVFLAQVALLVRYERPETKPVPAVAHENIARSANAYSTSQPGRAFPIDMGSAARMAIPSRPPLPHDVLWAHPIPLPLPLPAASERNASVIRHMDRLFERALSDFEMLSGSIEFERGWDRLLPSPALDMKEDDDFYVVWANIPGIRSEELSVTLDARILTLTALMRDENGTETGQWRTRIMLPGPVGRSCDIRMAYTNGCLRIAIPKARTPLSSNQAAALGLTKDD